MDQAAEQLEHFYDSIINFQLEEFLFPIDYFNQHLVKVSDSFYACNGKLFIDQLKFRMTSYTGLFSVLADYAYSAVMQDELYWAWIQVFDSADCKEWGSSVGTIVKHTMSAYASDEVFFKLVKEVY